MWFGKNKTRLCVDNGLHLNGCVLFIALCLVYTMHVVSVTFVGRQTEASRTHAERKANFAICLLSVSSQARLQFQSERRVHFFYIFINFCAIANVSFRSVQLRSVVRMRRCKSRRASAGSPVERPRPRCSPVACGAWEGAVWRIKWRRRG